MQNYKFEKKASKLSMKPLDLSCVLRVSQSQLSESGFRDAIIDLLYDRILETLQCHSHSTAFPEIALPVVLQLKAFIKKCPLANYTKKMKQLMEKIQETIKFIEKNRSHVNFDLADTKAVLALENQLKQSGTPLTTYHASWKKMKDREMAVKIARKPQVFYINLLVFYNPALLGKHRLRPINFDSIAFNLNNHCHLVPCFDIFL